MTSKKSILERLDNGEVIIGDGGFVFALEKRGYVKAGPWTPECTVEHPEAVKQLHREFLRAGADVMQTLTFYASDDKLENRGNVAGCTHGGTAINKAACDLARTVADEGGAFVAGGVSQTPTYLSGLGKEKTQEIFHRQYKVFQQEKVDLLVCEYFEHVEECVWAIEAAKQYKLPIMATLCIGPQGDMHGKSAGDCAVEMAKAGADIIGVNCHFDPFIVVETVVLMKKGLEAAGLKKHLVTQPLAYLTPDAGKQGFIDLPEFPFALEPRVCTRIDIQKYARLAYNSGIRFIGGCCGFEPYHTRAIAEELAPERGHLPKGSEKHEPWGASLVMHTKPWVRSRANRHYWETIKPASGRPFCGAYSQPDEWGVTAGDDLLKQHKEKTTEAEMKNLMKDLHVKK